MTRPTIFLSGVSREFGVFRDAVEHEVQRKECFAYNQPSFATDYLRSNKVTDDFEITPQILGAFQVFLSERGIQPGIFQNLVDVPVLEWVVLVRDHEAAAFGFGLGGD